MATEFMARVYSPAVKFVGESALALIPEEDHVALYHAMRQQLADVEDMTEFTVAVPGFVPTVVMFRCLPTAAMAMFGRTFSGTARAELVGAAFMFAGKNAEEEEEAIRRTAGGRDADRRPYPIPPEVYEQIRAERSRPFLALVLWNVAMAKDASMLAIARAMAGAFFDKVTQQ